MRGRSGCPRSRSVRGPQRRSQGTHQPNGGLRCRSHRRRRGGRRRRRCAGMNGRGGEVRPATPRKRGSGESARSRLPRRSLFRSRASAPPTTVLASSARGHSRPAAAGQMACSPPVSRGGGVERGSAFGCVRDAGPGPPVRSGWLSGRPGRESAAVIPRPRRARRAVARDGARAPSPAESVAGQCSRGRTLRSFSMTGAGDAGLRTGYRTIPLPRSGGVVWVRRPAISPVARLAVYRRNRYPRAASGYERRGEKVGKESLNSRATGAWPAGKWWRDSRLARCSTVAAVR
jgi:hypothetical protein